MPTSFVNSPLCRGTSVSVITNVRRHFFSISILKFELFFNMMVSRYTIKQRICSLCSLCVTVFALNTTPCINTQQPLCLCFNSKPFYLLPSLFCHAAIIGPMLELWTWMMMMNFNKTEEFRIFRTILTYNNCFLILQIANFRQVCQSSASTQ